MKLFKGIVFVGGALVAFAALFFLWSANSEGESIADAAEQDKHTAQNHTCATCSSESIPQSALATVGRNAVSAELKGDALLPYQMQPQLDALFNSFDQAQKVAIPADRLDFVWNAEVGDEVALAIPGGVLSGRIDSVADKESMRAVGVRLSNYDGRMVLQISETGRLIGHALFEGDTRAFDISGKVSDNWNISATTYSSLFCAPDGAIYRNTNAASVAVGDATRLTTAALAPGFTPIKLESLPGAEHVLYIDLDGETVTTPFWNSGATINASNHPQANNDAWVTVVWQRIAEDFAPFQINVTTDRSVFNSADSDKRVMCILTPDKQWYIDWYFENFGGVISLGGVARINSYGGDIVCWGFNIQEIGAAEVVSHEVGHTLGLIHDGVAGDDDQYFDGHGAGDVVSWAPIMGSGYTKAVTQWSMGEYENAVHYTNPEGTEIPNTQDDIDLILSNGFGYRADDAADDTGTANGLALSGTLIMDSGIIERVNDVDIYRVNSLGGDAVFTVQPLDVQSTQGEFGSQYAGANLAVQVALIDDNDNVIDSFNNPDELGGSMSVNLLEGTYYLKIENADRGDPATSGFSTYASLGQYFITGSVPSGPLSAFGGGSLDQFIADGDPVPEVANGTYLGATGLTSGSPLLGTFRLNNTGAFDITVTSLSLATPEFTADTITPIAIPIGGFVDVTVLFDASDIGNVSSSLTLEYSTTEPKDFSYTIPLGAVVTKTVGEDNYEDNDTYFTAYTLPEQTDLEDILGPGRQADNDWYTLNVLPGFNEISIDCTFSNAGGDINIALYDYRGYLMAVSEGTDDSEFIRFVGRPEGGAYRVRVYGEGEGNDYNLRWQGNSPLIAAPGAEDNYENNDNFNYMTNLTSNRGQNLSDIDGEGTQLDRDFYTIRIGTGHNTINVQLTETGTVGSAYVILKDGAGRALATSAVGTITYTTTTTSSRNYILTVEGDNLGQTYDLYYDSEFIAGPPPQDDSEDNYEENDTFFQPFDLSDDEGDFLPSGEARQFDPDWYRIESKDGDNAILVTMAPALDSLTFALYDYRGYQINSATSPGVFELLPVRTPFGTQTYYVKVVGDNSGESYDFSWESALIPEDDDIYETNNTIGTAFSLVSQEAISLSDFSEEGIQRDQDWYRISVAPLDNELAVTVDFDDSEGNIDVFIYSGADPDDLVAQSTTNTDQESILFEVPELPDDVEPFVRTYWILVTGDGAGNSYDLIWEATSDSEDDAYEENDSFEEAYVMPQTNGQLSTLLGTAIANDDLDFYRFDMPEGATSLAVTITFRNSEADLDMAAYDANFELIESSLSVGNRESVSFATSAVPDRDTVYIWVYTFGTVVGNEYDMRWYYGGLSSDLDADGIDDGWELNFAEDPDLLDSTSNSDADKYPLWAEYAFDLNPEVADEVKIETFEENGYMHVKFKVSQTALDAGYTYRVIESSSLPMGQDLAEYVRSEGNLRIYKSKTKMKDSAQCFFSVQLSLPE